MSTEPKDTTATQQCGLPDAAGVTKFRVIFYDPAEKANRESDLEAPDLPTAMRKAQHFFNHPRRVFPATNAQALVQPGRKETL